MYLAPVVVKAIEERIVIYNFNTIIIYKKPFHNWKGFFFAQNFNLFNNWMENKMF